MPYQKLSHDFSGALRTFTYFMASGTHYMLDGIDYSSLHTNPSELEMVYAIFANVIELDDKGHVANFTHAQKRATDYIRHYYQPDFIVDPPFEQWEMELYNIPTT